MSDRLLPEYVDDPHPATSVHDQHVRELEQEVRDLRRQLAEAQREATRARGAAYASTQRLRKQLEPWRSAILALFGELDDIAPGDAAAPSVDDRTRRVWDSWKSKLPAQAKVIDALLLHGEMNTQQLAIAVGLHRTTIPAHIFKLNQAGLINKNGGRFSLKEL